MSDDSNTITLHNRLRINKDLRPICSACRLELKFPWEVEDYNKYMTYPDVVKANRVLPLTDPNRPWVDKDLMIFCDPCYHKIGETIRLSCLMKQESDFLKKQQEKDKEKMSELLHKRCNEIEAIANGENIEEENSDSDLEIEKIRH